MKLVEFIKCVLYDWRNPPIKRPYGISCYVGLPGSGKTLSLVNELIERRKQFPKCKIYTNFGFVDQDGVLENWQQLIDLENGQDGIIFGIDEVHTLFNRNDWRDIPLGILLVFSQNRKFAKEFICTAQAFDDIVVDLRRRCAWIIDCKSFMNRWVFQRAFTPTAYSVKDDNRKESRKSWKRSFIATQEVYEAYDTYAIIENIKEGSKKEVPVGSPVRFEITKIPMEVE